MYRVPSSIRIYRTYEKISILNDATIQNFITKHSKKNHQEIVLSFPFNQGLLAISIFVFKQL